MKPIVAILFLLALCGCAAQKPDIRGQTSDLRPPTSVVQASPRLVSFQNRSGIQPPPSQPPFSELAIALWWDAEPDAESFNVYYGFASRSYETMLIAVTNYCAITDLIPGAQYFFSVTAVSNSVESDFSDEVSAVFDQTAGRVMRFYLPDSGLSPLTSALRSPDLSDWQPDANCFPVATNSDSQDWFLPNPQTTVFYRLMGN